MDEDLVPGEPVLFVDLQASLEETDGFGGEALALDDEGYSLDILCKLILAIASPWSAAV